MRPEITLCTDHNTVHQITALACTVRACHYIHFVVSLPFLTLSALGDALMLAAGRRTYLPMSVLAGMLLLILVVYILLYRKLSPLRALTGAGSSDSHKEAVSMQVLVNGNCEVEAGEFEEREEEGGEEEGMRGEDKEVQDEGLDEYGLDSGEEDTLL